MLIVATHVRRAHTVIKQAPDYLLAPEVEARLWREGEDDLRRALRDPSEVNRTFAAYRVRAYNSTVM